MKVSNPSVAEGFKMVVSSAMNFKESHAVLNKIKKGNNMRKLELLPSGRTHKLTSNTVSIHQYDDARFH